MQSHQEGAGRSRIRPMTTRSARASISPDGAGLKSKRKLRASPSVGCPAAIDAGSVNAVAPRIDCGVATRGSSSSQISKNNVRSARPCHENELKADRRSPAVDLHPSSSRGVVDRCVARGVDVVR